MPRGRRTQIEPGTRFTRLVVLRDAEPFIQGGQTRVCAVCDCGVEKVVFASSLLSGRTQSCGCLLIEKTTSHGKSTTPEYHTWDSTKQRCYNVKHKSYSSYGGRGIRMHEAWVNDPAAFIQYIEGLPDYGKKKTDGYSLDRIDPNGNYEPGNLRWASKKGQYLNQRPKVWAESTLGKATLAWTQLPAEERARQWASASPEVQAILDSLDTINLQD